MKVIKVLTLSALAALGLASCSNEKDLYDPNYFKQEASNNFKANIMNGQEIDAAQTWNTSVATRVAVTPSESGTIKVYPASPIGQTVAPLITVTGVQAGQPVEMNIARPQTAQTLFVAQFDNNGYVIERNVQVSNNEATVNFVEPASRATQARRVPNGLTPVFDFSAKAPKASGENFLAAVPYGIQKLTQNGPSCNNYIDETFTGDLNIWGAWNGSATSGGTIYLSGNLDFSNRKFYLASNTNVFLVKGTTLTLNAKDAANLQAGCNFYIAEGASIVTPSELVLNNGLHMYNRGTIQAAKLSVNNNSILYNEATVNVNGELSTENNNSVIVNDGDIKATRLHTAGSSHVQNNATINISGNTDIDSNDNTWVNNGQYVTGNFNYTAGSCDVINNCKLTVNERFYINLGDTPAKGFQNDADAGVVTKTLAFNGPGFIYLSNRSVFRVLETATMNITKDTYGIYGPASGEYAVFEAETIANGAADPNQGFVANYFRRVVVATNSHFAFGYSDKSAAQQAAGEVGAQPYYRLDANSGAKMASSKNGATDINIAPTTCNPGYVPGTVITNPDPDPTPDPTPDPVIPTEPTMYYFYAFEDLGVTDDFDFNDVVLAVTAPVNGTSDIYLMAAGGTLPTVVKLNGTQVGPEVHAAFEVSTATMVNTMQRTKSFVRIGQATNVTDASNLPLTIVVTKTDGQSTEVAAPVQGEAPLMIRTAGNSAGKWFWAKERINIDRAYPGFGAWGANYVNGGGWDANFVSDNVITY